MAEIPTTPAAVAMGTIPLARLVFGVPSF